MTDRERWIVYPLLLMALGLALQPKISQVDARFGEVKCERLTCSDIVARRASIDATSSKQVDVEGLAVTDSLGVRQAQIVSTKQGGRIDIDRYSIGGDAAARNRSFEIYVIDRRGVRIPLGNANWHLVAAEKPKGELDELPKADGNEPASDAASEPAE